MRSLLACLIVTSFLAVGCDRTISERETVKTRNDGTVTKSSETVKERPDGTIAVEKSKETNK